MSTDDEGSQNTLGRFINQVIHGDCLDVLAQMPAKSVDLVVTDPPYLVGYKSRDGRTISNDRTADWLKPAFREMYRVLKDNRFCVSFYGWNKAERFMWAWKDAGFTPVSHFVWVKDYASKQGFTRAYHESAYLLAKGNPEKPRTVISDVLEWQYTGNTLHPTQKPVMAITPLILSFSKRGDVVLDPFAGSGTTAVASKQTGRKYIAIEKERQYYTIASKRVEGESGVGNK